MAKEKFYVLCLLCFNLLGAQKVVEKTLIAPNTSFIQIDASKCFLLQMETSNANEMVVEAIIDGEYKKDLMLNIKEEGSTVLVSTNFQPNFINPNDKLSAHKVISIALRVIMPKHKNVQIYGSSCNVSVSGRYENLAVTLGDGQCALDNVGELVHVNTQSGDIRIKSAGAQISATTKYGEVHKEPIVTGSDQYIINTVTGNIYLRKTE